MSTGAYPPTGVSYPIQTQFNSLLYKKIQGVPYTNNAATLNTEKAGSSNFTVQNTTVWTQSVPLTAPTSLTKTKINVSYDYGFKYTPSPQSPVT